MSPHAHPSAAETLRAFFERRSREEAIASSSYLERLQAAAALLAHRLYAAGAERVFLFGSAATGGVHPGSDLDLAAEGLRPERYFELLGELLMHAPCGVDLVRLEEAPASLRAHVLETGLLLNREMETEGSCAPEGDGQAQR